MANSRYVEFHKHDGRAVSLVRSRCGMFEDCTGEVGNTTCHTRLEYPLKGRDTILVTETYDEVAVLLGA